MPKQPENQKEIKTINCWIATDGNEGVNPIIYYKKPPKLEVLQYEVFGYKIYSAKIIYEK